jgi:hypothetical protein
MVPIVIKAKFESDGPNEACFLKNEPERMNKAAYVPL